jgi:hypothetical protein
MRIFLVGFHFVLGIALLIVGVSVLEDYWKTPALISLVGGIASISIGIGMLAKACWVRWIVGLLVLIATAIALFLLAGSVIWPDSAALVILLIYGAFLAVELLTWHQICPNTSLQQTAFGAR